MAIFKPSQETFNNQRFSAILYGAPGVGKTTAACSAPNPILIDLDKGIQRIRAQHRPPFSRVSTYEELLEDLKSDELKDFDTIVIDTGGSLITLLQDYVMRKDSANKTKSGTISQKGYGAVKAEFQALTNRFKTVYDKNIIYVFHSVEEKNKYSALDIACKEYITLSTTLFELFKEFNARNLRTAFATYIAEDNAREKREVYFAKLNRKISRCERHIDRLESRYNMWRLFFRKSIIENPQTLRLLIWRNRLELWNERLNHAEKDVKYARVRYLHVTEQSIFGNSDEKNRSSRDMHYHTAEHNVEILAKKLLLVFVFGFAASLGFVFNPVVWSVEFVYKMALRLFQIGMALYTGISDADKFVDGDMCDALSRRIVYVQGFKERLITK